MELLHLTLSSKLPDTSVSTIGVPAADETCKVFQVNSFANIVVPRKYKAFQIPFFSRVNAEVKLH